MRYNNYYCSDGEQVTPIDIEEHDRQVRNKAINECIGIIDTWREDYLEHKEQNPINYGLILDFKRWMEKLKEQKNDI